MSPAMHPLPSLMQMPPTHEALSPPSSTLSAPSPSAAAAGTLHNDRNSHPSPPLLRSPAHSPIRRPHVSSISTTANAALTALSTVTVVPIPPTPLPITPVSVAPLTQRPDASAAFLTSPTSLNKEIGCSRRPSRRRTGPLSAQQREKAALIRKLGACGDCRRRRVACHPGHHDMTWEEVKKHCRSPNMSDMVLMSPGFLGGHSDHSGSEPGRRPLANGHTRNSSRYGHNSPSPALGHDHDQVYIRDAFKDSNRYPNHGPDLSANSPNGHLSNTSPTSIVSIVSNNSSNSNNSKNSKNSNNSNNSNASNHSRTSQTSNTSNNSGHGNGVSTYFRPGMAHGQSPPDPMDLDLGFHRHENGHENGHNNGNSHGHLNPMRPQTDLPGRLGIMEGRSTIRTPLPSNPALLRPREHPALLSPNGATTKTRSVNMTRSADGSLASSLAHHLATSSGRYSAAEVLLLHWHDDAHSSEVASATQELSRVLEQQYHFSLHSHTIATPVDRNGVPRSAWRWLSRLVNDFAEDRDQRDVLKIVYYNGYSFLDANRDMVLANSCNRQKACTIRWSGIQQILEEACADTLIIMDAPYFPSSRMVRQQGVLELIAACVSGEHFDALGRCAFTRALTDQLRISSRRAHPLSAAELHADLLSSYSKIVCDRSPEAESIHSFPAPLHIQLSGNPNLPSIFLAPIWSVPVTPPYACGISTADSVSGRHHLQLSFRLQERPPGLDEWLAWFRLMPDGIESINVLDSASPSRSLCS